MVRIPTNNESSLASRNEILLSALFSRAAPPASAAFGSSAQTRLARDHFHLPTKRSPHHFLTMRPQILDLVCGQIDLCALPLAALWLKTKANDCRRACGTFSTLPAPRRLHRLPLIAFEPADDDFLPLNSVNDNESSSSPAGVLLAQF